jgi:two-component system, OmpR family, response regulator
MKIENERILLNELDENLRALMVVPSYKLGAYTFDVANRELSFSGAEPVKLTRKETYLFVLFAANANSMLDRKYMLTTIWKDDNYYNSRSMDVYICKIRKLLSKDPSIVIVNIHGKGYRIVVG